MKGLTSEEAARLLRQYGLNVIAEKRQRPFLKKLFEQFNNFLIILLLFASLVSFFLGQVLDGWLILIIVVLNAAFGLYQEGKAEQAVLLLKKMAVTKTRVFRDGVEQEIESTALVPGDIILVEEGDKIPADGVLVAAHNLELNESALTGESLPIPKDSKEKVFMGTIIAKGRGRVKVEETGMHTEFGKITAHLAEIERVKSPLEKRLVALSRTIGIVGIVISAVAFWLSYSLGNTIFSSFLLAVSLAVAVVPEGLPAVMTITLAIGVSEMAKKKAIMRKLSAIEALGSVTLIATDKTGTITSNKMEVVRIYVDQNEYHISKPPYLSNHPFAKMILDGVLCSTASLVYVHDPSTSLRASHGRHDVLGDPTEGALLLLAQKVGVFPDKAREEWETVDEASFDSITKRMAVRVRRGAEELVFVKGATESVLELSGKIFLGETEEAMSAKRLSEIRQTMDGWTEKGYRVLAFAFRKVERGENYVLS
ncbi:HAD-IC family P-type ATPase, partial [Candidatus Roizmanbacteria bacterium]|nr:HAD-IC family P-type ATPase [Candidatus Roizmanbacteria bacterium]